MPVTIRDIARRVGKSVTTVSRALHDYDDISAETKALVRRTAEEMGYRPNTLAQRLQKRKADTLGLVLPTFGPRFSDPFFSEFLAGVGNQAAESNYDLLVSTRAPGEEEAEAYRSIVETHRVDGFILLRIRRDDQRIEYLRRRQVPFVAFGRTHDQLDYPFVDEDGKLGLRLVVEHLLELGHTRLSVIASPPELNFTAHRLEGVYETLAEHGLELDDSLMMTGDMTQRCGYQQAARLLDRPDRPSAIIAFNDLMALGALSAALERGLLVGRQVSITGFDNIPLAEHSHPPLTTVHQPIYQIGTRLCEMLIEIIENQPSPGTTDEQPALLAEQQVLLQPELVVRSSTGPAVGSQ